MIQSHPGLRSYLLYIKIRNAGLRDERKCEQRRLGILYRTKKRMYSLRQKGIILFFNLEIICFKLLDISFQTYHSIT